VDFSLEALIIVVGVVLYWAIASVSRQIEGLYRRIERLDNRLTGGDDNDDDDDDELSL
jgi:hypothetical protein